MSSDLWSFALAVYARPGVEDACLHLQSAGASVCLMLCGLWLEQRDVTCDEARVQQLQEVTAPWDREVVQPLRTLRMQWKTTAEADPVLKGMRDQIKGLNWRRSALCCRDWKARRRAGRATLRSQVTGWKPWRALRPT